MYTYVSKCKKNDKIKKKTKKKNPHSMMERVNLIKVHCKHIQESHSEPPV
jgi:hypothetical protein